MLVLKTCFDGFVFVVLDVPSPPFQQLGHVRIIFFTTAKVCAARPSGGKRNGLGFNPKAGNHTAVGRDDEEAISENLAFRLRLIRDYLLFS